MIAAVVVYSVIGVVMGVEMMSARNVPVKLPLLLYICKTCQQPYILVPKMYTPPPQIGVVAECRYLSVTTQLIPQTN